MRERDRCKKDDRVRMREREREREREMSGGMIFVIRNSNNFEDGSFFLNKRKRQFKHQPFLYNIHRYILFNFLCHRYLSIYLDWKQ
jgi:hypothetical protein